VQKLNREIARIIREPDVKVKLDRKGVILAGGPPEELGKLIAAEIKRWTDVARANKISVQRQDRQQRIGFVAATLFATHYSLFATRYPLSATRRTTRA
jgi:hypothetical protein